MEFDNHIIWNILLTMIIGPLGFLVRNALSELKRVDILLNRTMEESEPLLNRDGTRFKSGGYRKNGMWKPKGKYFSEESPPPECPMHKGEDDVS